MIILASLLATTNEAEKRLLLLHGHRKDAASCLEMILELLVKMQWRLDLDQGAKLGVVVLDVEAALLILLDESMLPAHRNIMDAHVGVVATTKLDLVDIIEVNNVKLLLLLVVVLGRVYLERLNN